MARFNRERFEMLRGQAAWHRACFNLLWGKLTPEDKALIAPVVNGTAEAPGGSDLPILCTRLAEMIEPHVATLSASATPVIANAGTTDRRGGRRGTDNRTRAARTPVVAVT